MYMYHICICISTAEAVEEVGKETHLVIPTVHQTRHPVHQHVQERLAHLRALVYEALSYWCMQPQATSV